MSGEGGFNNQVSSPRIVPSRPEIRVPGILRQRAWPHPLWRVVTPRDYPHVPARRLHALFPLNRFSRSSRAVRGRSHSGCHLPIWCRPQDSNPQKTDYSSDALPFSQAGKLDAVNRRAGWAHATLNRTLCKSVALRPRKSFLTPVSRSMARTDDVRPLFYSTPQNLVAGVGIEPTAVRL